MILLGTATSPYMRIVRVALRDRGLLRRVEERIVPTRIPDSPVLAYNPTGKVPTLVTDEGVVLSETRLICGYLDTLHPLAPITPPPPDLAARARDGMITGFLDGVSVWVREMRRLPQERSPGILAQERARAERCLRRFETGPEALGSGVDLPTLSLAAALDFLGYGVPDFAWRQGHPRLHGWLGQYGASAAMRETAPPQPSMTCATEVRI